MFQYVGNNAAGPWGNFSDPFDSEVEAIICRHIAYCM